MEKKFEVTTIIPAKHSTGTITLPGRARPMPMILWEVRVVPIETKADEPEEEPKKKPEKYRLADVLTNWPASHEEPVSLKFILVDACAKVSKAQLQQARLEAIDAGYLTVKGNLEKRTEAGDRLVAEFLKGVP